MRIYVSYVILGAQPQITGMPRWERSRMCEVPLRIRLLHTAVSADGISSVRTFNDAYAAKLLRSDGNTTEIQNRYGGSTARNVAV